MNTLKTVGISFVVALLVTVGAVLLFPSAGQPVGAGGGDHYFFEQFFGGLGAHVVVELGGVQTNNATATTTTVTANQICSGDAIAWAPVTNNSTATIDTSANLASNCLNKNGNSVILNLTNPSATSTYNVVFPANYTVFHVNSSSLSTTITSSTPAEFEIFVNQIATTSTVSSTFFVYRTQFVTP